jgi:hypothetical protein
MSILYLNHNGCLAESNSVQDFKTMMVIDWLIVMMMMMTTMMMLMIMID